MFLETDFCVQVCDFGVFYFGGFLYVLLCVSVSTLWDMISCGQRKAWSSCWWPWANTSCPSSSSTPHRRLCRALPSVSCRLRLCSIGRWDWLSGSGCTTNRLHPPWHTVWRDHRGSWIRETCWEKFKNPTQTFTKWCTKHIANGKQRNEPLKSR